MELLLEVINGSELKSGCSPSWAFRPAGGIIGRNFDCEWCIDDQDSYISRQHVCITSEHTAFYLTDLSRNGIIVNGIETLKAGVRHRVGQGDTYLLGTLEVHARLIEPRGMHSGRQHPLPIFEGAVVGAHDPFFMRQSPNNGDCSVDDFSSLAERRLDTEITYVQTRVDREQVRLPTWVPESTPVLHEPFLQTPDEENGTFWQRFGEALDVDLTNIEPSACEALATHVARLFKQCIEGLEHASSTRNELMSEWQLSAPAVGERDDASAEVRFDSVIRQLLLRQSTQVAQTIIRSFRDSQAHQVALLAGCRAMARSTLEHFSPQRLHWQFEHERKSRLRTCGSRWRAYVSHHRTLAQDDTWSAGLWARDFTSAYDEQIRLINSL
ncbi:type VI secretion system-associated FHA domain protein [Pseudomonas viridiflava]|uniref:FHA domain-containing protein n=1 Tax=Pseudomonas viridiflava TaxID=33069 RepID=A0A3M5P216_PSEVI|nr:type VI secretion system-associated FHA domain protein [Pseudomonas viridiflava]RMT78561.1 hypothetical protein ALP40_01984 [Pseudomonas viridiflava]